MGRDLIIFWLMGSSTTTRSLWKTLWQQNFLNKSECLILLQKDSLEWLYHLNFFFVWQFRIVTETYRIGFAYWWLLQLFTSVCRLKSSLCFYTFSNMFRHLVFINLLFTLYIIYFMDIIYIIYYIIQLISRGFLAKI